MHSETEETPKNGPHRTYDTCKQCDQQWVRFEYVGRKYPEFKICATCAARRWSAHLRSLGARAMAERRKTGGKLH
jgi:hypothetical protein